MEALLLLPLLLLIPCSSSPALTSPPGPRVRPQRVDWPSWPSCLSLLALASSCQPCLCWLAFTDRCLCRLALLALVLAAPPPSPAPCYPSFMFAPPACLCSHSLMPVHSCLCVLSLCSFALAHLHALLHLHSFIPAHLCLIGCRSSTFGLHLCLFVLVRAPQPLVCLSIKYIISIHDN